MNKFKKVITLVLMVVLVCSMALTTGCSNKASSTSGNYKKTDVAVTIDGEKLTMADMLYYIYSYESQIDYMDQMYQYYFNTGYWDMEIEEGKTIRQDSKEQAMTTAIRYEVLYKEAIKNNYSLTDDEIATIKENSVAVIEEMSEEQLKLTGFTEETVTEIQKKWSLTDKYYQDLIDALDVDDEAIKASIDKEEYKEYSVEYILVPTTTEDAEGNVTSLSDDEKKAAKEKADKMYNIVKESGKLADGVADDDDESTVYTDLSFLPNDENETTNKTFMEEAMKLANEEISGVIETEDGYYIIRMVDNAATTKYEEAVTTAIQEVEDAKFDEEFAVLEKSYNVEINDKVWDKVVMGNNTIVATTADTTSTEE
ncbi:peptidylprolyl isomerase [Anaerosporobacter sp.]|uniref:peptidylprolyl isomerase n=1 Tax=Anaerosporobacter sp. TaxID=1872529 RepID=UPI00286F7600|nr:peptidylprolyl isomerase [Anaerosporobacter sp.]